MNPQSGARKAHGSSRLGALALLGALAIAAPTLAQGQGQSGSGGQAQGADAQASEAEDGPGIDLPLIGRVGLPGFMAGWFGGDEEEEKQAGGGEAGEGGEGANGEPPAVIVQNVETRSVGDTFEFIGTIQPIERVGVRARVEGYIQEVAFNGGQQVRQGDLLFQIEPAQYEAALRAAEAQLSGAEATRNQAQRNFDRQNELVQSGVTARATLEDATASLENAQAQFLQAEAAVTQARLDVSYTRITAAIDGEMSAPLITRGNYVSATSGDLATLTQMNPIWGVFPIGEGQLVTWQRVGPRQSDEAPLAEAQPNGQTGGGGEAQGDAAGGGETLVASSEMTSSTGETSEAPVATAEGTGAAGAPPPPEGAQTVDAASDASDNGLASDYRLQLRLPNGALYEPPGRFDFVGNTVNGTTGTVEARIRFPNPGQFLLANQNVTLTASERNPPTLPVVPQAAIQFSREGRAVLLVKPDNSVERRAIEIGRTIDNMSAVTRGLEGGETLVLRGSAGVKEGTRVRPVTQEQADAEAQARRQSRTQGEGQEGGQGGQGQGGSQGGEGQGGAGNQDGGSGTAAGQNSGSGSSAR